MSTISDELDDRIERLLDEGDELLNEMPDIPLIEKAAILAVLGWAGSLPSLVPVVLFVSPFDVTPEQEVGPQLLKLGIRSDDVRTVILTHLHTDHAGGLHHFPKSKILVSDKELAIARGFAGRLRN